MYMRKKRFLHSLMALSATAWASLCLAQTSETVVTIAVHPENPGYRIPDDFIGLSIEETALIPTSPGFQFEPDNAVIERLFSQLAPAHMRWGGNSVDELTGWTHGQRTASSPTNILYSSDVDNAVTFARKVGWKILWGLGMGHMDAAADADQAAYVAHVANGMLEGFEIGNEPNLYHSNGMRSSSYNVTDYFADWQPRANAVKLRVSGARIADAAATQAGIDNWTAYMAKTAGSQLGLITQHDYPMTPPDKVKSHDQIPATIADMLSENARQQKEAYYGYRLYQMSQEAKIPWRMAETNSVNYGGQKGVSDVFASALWGLDYMFTLASYRAAGIDFHCGRMGGYSGSPIQVMHNHVMAKPLYYALLMFRQAAQGHLVPLDMKTNGVNITAYGVLNRQTRLLRVLLINKDMNKDTKVIIIPGNAYHVASGIRLKAPALNADTGIVLGDASIAADGSWAPAPSTAREWKFGEKFYTPVPAGSAQLIIFKP